MKENMQPELILEQMKTLGDIYRHQFGEIDRSIRKGFSALEVESLRQVYALGDGDSYYAALGADMAFRELGRIAYDPLPAYQYLAYEADYIKTSFPRDTLVVGISASGGTVRVVEALEKTRSLQPGLMVAGMVGKAGSRVAEVAERTLLTELPELGRSPGIRTFYGSLLGLYSLAIRIGEIKRHFHSDDANTLRNELIGLADSVEATFEASLGPARLAAAACYESSFISFTGSGPSFASASFSGAKVVESAGVFPGVQDLEEWAHVERFAHPLDYPVLLVAPPGKGYWRALDLAKAIKLLGHPLLAVVSEDDREIAPMADIVFPVRGAVREAFSPLLYTLAGTVFAYELARELNRCLFMTDNPAVMQARQEMMRQIQGKQ